jgi:hypothetical protein
VSEIQYSGEVQRYLNMIADYEKDFKDWEERARKICERYRDDKKKYSTDNEATRFNILWSNVQTLVPATYSRLPRPDVSRRFKDSDPVGRVASLILERALDFDIQHHTDFRTTMWYSVNDRFLGGRATAWVRYEPQVVPQTDPKPVDGELTKDADSPSGPEVTSTESLEQIAYECAPLDYVQPRDFGHSKGRIWEEVTCVWRKVYMKRADLIKRFGEEVGKRIPLDASPTDNSQQYPQQTEEAGKTALIYEIWDKETLQAVWVCKSYGEILDAIPDPLELEDFFPCPRPLYATLTTDKLVPVPDFIFYQDQANELDIISDRIDGLIKALKVRGVYDSSVKELQRLFTETGGNDLIPVANWQKFAEKSGLAGAMDLVDLKPIAEALMTAYQARSEVMDQIYTITGLADIIRGESDPRTTAKAEGIKARFGTLRLRNTQEEVARYASDLIRLKAQVICGKFSNESLLSYGATDQLLPDDQQYVPAALELLRGEIVRDFRVEIAADSLVQIDEEQTKQDRTDFLTAVSGFIREAVQAGQAMPEMAPVLIEMLKFYISGFKAGKTLEGAIDAALDRLNQMAKQTLGQPKPPSPEQQKIQADMQIAQAKQQGDMQIEQARQAFEREKFQMQMALDQRKAELDAQVAMAQQQAQAEQSAQEHREKMQADMVKAQLEQHTETLRSEMQMQMEEMRGQVQVLITHLTNMAKIEVAEIGAETTLDAAQISAARTAEAE